MNFNPVLYKALRVQSRSYAVPLAIGAVNAVLFMLGFFGASGVISGMRQNLSTNYGAFLDIYFLVCGTEFLLLLLVLPGIGAAGLSSERASGTLELVISTRLSPLSLVLGKLEAMLLYTSVIIVSCIPAMILPLMYGGVKVTDAVVLALLYIPEAAYVLAACLCVTARETSVLKSSVMAYAGLFALLGGPVFPALMGRMLTPAGRNFAALALLICPGFPAADRLFRLCGRGSLSRELFLLFGLDPAGGIAGQAAPVSLLLHLALTVLFVLLAAYRAAPVRRRR